MHAVQQLFGNVQECRKERRAGDPTWKQRIAFEKLYKERGLTDWKELQNKLDFFQSSSFSQNDPGGLLKIISYHYEGLWEGMDCVEII